MAKDCKCVKLNLFIVLFVCFWKKMSDQNFCERESVRVCLMHGKPVLCCELDPSETLSCRPTVVV